ncbi:MAG TPA: MFS transporter [Paenalcaligenes sp.]|nr:MFS transporter [Paenalcaligenes sp.]
MGLIYRSPRVWPLLFLGFGSGLPLALTSNTLQAWLTVEQVSLTKIGFLTLAGSAYTLKFLWAPFLDRFQIPFLGRRRGWILLTQLLLGVSIFAMGWFPPSEFLWVLALLAMWVAFLSATQDVAFDAYSTDVLRPRERAAGAAVRVMGYRLAMIVSSGLALVLAERYLGWSATYMLLGALMLGVAVFTFLAPEPEHVAVAPKTLKEAVVEPLFDFFQRPGAWAFLWLIVLYKMGDAFAGALSTTFLIRGAGFSVAQVGAINNIFGLGATIVGALMGGVLLARLGLYRALMGFGLLQAFSNFGYWLVTVWPDSWQLMAAVVAIENLCGGLGTAAFVAFVMALCTQAYSATQFALLSALSAIGRTYVAGPASPFLVGWFDWSGFFLFTVAIALPGLVLLRMKKQDILKLNANGAN